MAKATRKKRQKRTKKPSRLFEQSQAVFQQLEGLLGFRVVSLSSQITPQTVGVLNDVLRRIGPTETLYLYIATGGGNGEVALRIVHLLRSYANRLVALVPRECASAGTMLALGCEELRMGPLGYLTAVDVSLRHALSPVDKNNDLVSVSHDELVRAIRLWRAHHVEQPGDAFAALYPYVHPLVIGALDRSTSLSIRICNEILSYHYEDEETAQRISRQLNEDYPSHGYPITEREAQRLGLNAAPLESEIAELLADLGSVYAEMNQRAITDYDEYNYHNHRIGGIFETSGVQVFYQFDIDWHYREQERRWVPMNDRDRWVCVEREASGNTKETVLHV